PFRLHVHPDAERGGPAVTCNNPGPQGACSNFLAVEGGCQLAADCVRTARDPYAATIDLLIKSDQYPNGGERPQRVILDLDLDVSLPSVAASEFVEGFESSGFFQMNLDADKASNSLSDG